PGLAAERLAARRTGTRTAPASTRNRRRTDSGRLGPCPNHRRDAIAGIPRSVSAGRNRRRRNSGGRLRISTPRSRSVEKLVGGVLRGRVVGEERLRRRTDAVKRLYAFC